MDPRLGHLDRGRRRLLDLWLGRFRRQLRAQSVVNRQLYAQLEGGTVRVASGTGTAEGARKSLNVPRVTDAAMV